MEIKDVIVIKPNVGGAGDLPPLAQNNKASANFADVLQKVTSTNTVSTFPETETTSSKPLDINNL